MAVSFSIANLPKFVKVATYAKFLTLEKDEKTLYFIEDRNFFYRGSQQLAFQLKKIAADPTVAANNIAGETGTIFYRTDNQTAYLYDGSAFLQLGVPKATSIPAAAMATDDGTVPTTKAAKDYVDAAIAASEAGDNYITKLPTGSAEGAVAANEIVLGDGSGELKGSGKAIGGATLAATPDANTLATEAAVKDAADSAEAAAKTYADGLVSALGSVFNYKGTVATISLLPASDNKTGDVYNVQTVSGGSSAEYVWNGSAWEELGTALDLSGYMTKQTSAVANNFAKFDANGQAVDSGKTYGGATLAATPSADTMASEAAVKTYADAAAAAKISKLQSVAENTLVASDGNGELKSAGVTVGGATLAGTPDTTKVATEAAVKAYADGKISKVAGSAANQLPVINSNGELDASGVTIKSSGDLSSSSSTTVPTDNVVYAAIQAALDQLAWQSVAAD